MTNPTTPTRSFGEAYRGRRALVTGHTGFKGSWLCQWLDVLGASVAGYALQPETTPNHFDLLQSCNLQSTVGDLANRDLLTKTVLETQPEVVFHLAAQPLVRRSYREPHATFATNLLGTLNVLQACRDCRSVRAIIIVTSDKVYENQESLVGYRESSALGGADPYSCSKACTELATACFRQSYFSDSGSALIATARAGNVIGGGDWSEDRLIPDAVRAAASGERLLIRNPTSVRPWQHVLEPLAGYLLLGQKLLAGDQSAATAWNFGPDEPSHVAVGDVISAFKKTWPDLEQYSPELPEGPHETRLLKLDSTLARERLGWKPVWDWPTTIARTAGWYREYYGSGSLRSVDDLTAYTADARAAACEWATA